MIRYFEVMSREKPQINDQSLFIKKLPITVSPDAQYAYTGAKTPYGYRLISGDKCYGLQNNYFGEYIPICLLVCIDLQKTKDGTYALDLDFYQHLAGAGFDGKRWCLHASGADSNISPQLAKVYAGDINNIAFVPIGVPTISAGVHSGFCVFGRLHDNIQRPYPLYDSADAGNYLKVFACSTNALDITMQDGVNYYAYISICRYNRADTYYDSGNKVKNYAEEITKAGNNVKLSAKWYKNAGFLNPLKIIGPVNVDLSCITIFTDK